MVGSGFSIAPMRNSLATPPLSALAGYVGLLAHRISEHLDTKGYIIGAAQGAARMERLLLGLLAYSRVGHQGRQFTRLDLNVVLREALRNLDHAI